MEFLFFAFILPISLFIGWLWVSYKLNNYVPQEPLEAPQESLELPSERRERLKAESIVDMSIAYANNDATSAIEIWKRPENARHDVSTFVNVMKAAQRDKRRWMGEKVNGFTVSHWRIFLEETSEAAQDDFIVEIQKRSRISN